MNSRLASLQGEAVEQDRVRKLDRDALDGAVADHGGGRVPTTSLQVVEREPSVSIQCFGGFRMAVDGLAVDWSHARPRARVAMRLLALRAGQPVHREALIEALWPGLPPEAAMANLHVAVSSLRRCLEPDRVRGKAGLLVRVDQAYRLALPADGHLDVVAFQRALARWRHASGIGDRLVAVAALREALGEYRGELLPEDGPAEWLHQDREMYRRQAVDAAATLAGVELDAGNPGEAVAAAEKGLAIDPFHDVCWQVLRKAYEQIGAPAAAERVRRRYTEVLAALGVGPNGRTGDNGPSTQVSHRSEASARSRRPGPM